MFDHIFMRVAAIVCLALGAVAYAANGCSASSKGGSQPDPNVTDANASFAFALLKHTCGAGENKNVFVSPLSVSFALSMTYNGAAKVTAEAMAATLGYSDVDIDDLNRAMKGLGESARRSDEGLKITLANSLWGSDDVRFSDAFFDANRDFYNAKISILDFKSPEALGTINGWVKDSTNGLIDKIIDSIPADAVLYLINAIYFKGVWLAEFNPKSTTERDFRTADGSAEPVPMMRQSGSYHYAEQGGVQAVRLPYDGDKHAMYVFLPAPGTQIDSLVSALDDAGWTQWREGLAKRDGDVYLPRFKMEYECTLNNALIAMGMGVAFDARRADFSRIAAPSDTRGNLVISEVKHKAVVDVNEEGTEAAAVTSVEIKATSASPGERFRFVADRPFFFLIYDEEMETILFMGIVHHPAS